MKLHIGCGPRNLPGWKHFDIRKIDEHIDYVGSADDLSQFSDNSIEEIYASQLLEHFDKHHIDKVLSEWNRVLKPGGLVRISVPDMEAVIAEYNANHDLKTLWSFFHGGQKYDYDYHYSSFDFQLLKAYLESNGFEDVQRYDWRDFLPEGYDDYSRSYLPHMDFENGRLMSLNVTARKHI